MHMCMNTSTGSIRPLSVTTSHQKSASFVNIFVSSSRGAADVFIATRVPSIGSRGHGVVMGRTSFIITSEVYM